MSEMTADQLLQKLRQAGSLREILDELKPAQAMSLLIEPTARRQRRSLERLMRLHQRLASIEAQAEGLQQLCTLLKAEGKPEMQVKIAVALLKLDRGRPPAKPRAARPRPAPTGNLAQSQGLLNRFLEFISDEKRREAMGPLPDSATEAPPQK